MQTANFKRLWQFFGLTFVISWGIWIPMGRYEIDNQALFWIAGFGPSLAAVILLVLAEGWAGARAALKRLFVWRGGWRYSLISLFATPAIMGIALWMHTLLGGETPRLVDPNHMVTAVSNWPLVIVVFLYVLVFTSLGEEIGWRGYALPRLSARFSGFGATLILGAVWAVWHAPLFWMSSNFHQQLPVSWFVLQVVGSTFVYTWLYDKTNGSLPVMLLFHTSSNAAVGLLPMLPLDNGGSLRPLWITVGLLWLVVALLLWFDKGIFFRSVKAEGPMDPNPGPLPKDAKAINE